jgi:hypothetical protein
MAQFAEAETLEGTRMSLLYAQIYCTDEHGRLSLTRPEEIPAARTHKDAADIACGKGASETGTRDLLAAKIWRSGPNGQPEIKLFYRPSYLS